MPTRTSVLRVSFGCAAVLMGAVACGPRVALEADTGALEADTGALEGDAGALETDTGALEGDAGGLDGEDDGVDSGDADSGGSADLPTPAGPCANAGWGPDGEDDVPGSVVPTHGYWAWDRCCVARPVIHLLEDTPVLDVGGMDELPEPRVEATIDLDEELAPPLQGEYDGRMSVVSGGPLVVGGPATIEILEPVSPEDAPMMGAPLHANLRFGPALDLGPFTASYCAALEPTDCDCGG
ncbi:MAG: hypothetical protein JNK45_02690 [Myxococcales bacterium]|nr:hypothetical protein [Myxococcales bacterium]